MRLRELLALLVVVLATAALARVPLFAVPSYEPGLVVGAMAALLCGWLAARRARLRPAHVTLRWGLLSTSPGQAVLDETRSNARLGALLVGLPLVLLATNALRAECRLSVGPWTFLFIAAPAAFSGMALGTLLGSVARRPSRVLALAVLCVGLAAALALAEALAGPRTFAHDLFLGPLSASGYMGYDSGLTFPPSAYLHRAWSVVVSCGMLVVAALLRTRSDAPPQPEDLSSEDLAAAASGWRSSEGIDAARARLLLTHHRRGVLGALSIVAVLAAPFALMPGRCGITPGQRLLERQLAKTAETEHFRIHYARGSAVEAHLERLAIDLEFSRHQVTGWLDIDPGAKVDAWIHPDAATLFRLTGARGFLFAQPWRHGFHGVLDHGRVRALRHELVHVLVADSGPPPFRASPSMGLTEGIATALDEGYLRDPQAHAKVAAGLAAGYLPRAQDLVSVVRFGGTNMDTAYRASASLVGWMIRRSGPGPVLEAYRWGRVESALGSDLGTLDAQWREFLAREVRPSATDAAWARRRFDPVARPAFYRTRCARLGTVTRFGPLEHADLLAREGLHVEAADMYCSLPDALVDPQVLEAAAWERLRAGQLEPALELATSALRAQPPESTRTEPLRRLRFRLLARRDRLDEARAQADEWRRDATWPDEVALESEALERADLRERYFSAALAAAPDDALILGALLETDPDFAPAMSLLLDREPTQAPVSPARRAMVLRLAEIRPGPLAAERLLALSRALEDGRDWTGSGDACARVLAMAGLLSWQRLEAEDGAGRAAWAESVRVVVEP